jgi:small-conductance mechanosensitive channel
MESLDRFLQEVVTAELFKTALIAGTILIVGLATAYGLHRKLRLANLGPQANLLVRRFASYTVAVLTVIWFLRTIGVDLGVLLGAAGILTVAIGFASQTSASNVISGLFLMGEQPFVVGDVIKVGDVSGEVLTIDLMSVKIRTFDNLQVRIPNETMLKSNVTTLTRFPIRRLDMKLGVAYREDLDRVRTVLFELADRNPVCLAEPAPLFIFLGFGDSSQDFQFSVWGTKENYLVLLNSMHLEVKKAFDAEGIEIPFPHRTLVQSSGAEPLSVQVVPE